MTLRLAETPAPIAREYPPGPVWSWPRPSAEWLRPGDGPAIELTWQALEVVERDEDRRPAIRLASTAGVATSTPTPARWVERTRWFAVTPETRDKAWWRSRLPGVAYRVHLLPLGMDHSATWHDLGSVGAYEDPAPLLVVAPASVMVQLPGADPVRAQLVPGSMEAGAPAYSLALSLPVARLLRAMRDVASAATAKAPCAVDEAWLRARGER